MVLRQNQDLLPNCFYIKKMMCDQRGNLWIATANSGIYVLNRKREVVSSYSFGSGESCFSLLESPDGYIYIGTSQGNCVRYNPELKSYEEYIKAWHQFLTQCQKEAKSLEPEQLQVLTMFLLKVFYRDTYGADFYGEFKRRLEDTKKKLNLAG